MKRIIHKVFWLWQFDKEEKWLNEMSAKGWQLSDVGFCRYVFQQGAPGEYIYRLEMLNDMPNSLPGSDYIRFIEDTGAEQVASMLRWVYFRRRAELGEFDLFSDIDSRLTHLNRLLVLTWVLALMCLINGFVQLHNWFSYRVDAQLILALLCLAVSALIGYGWLKFYRTKRRLHKEKLLHE